MLPRASVSGHTSRDIYADKGGIDCERKARRGEAQGWRLHIQRKGKDNALSKAQERRNRHIASPRARVKLIFAGLAQLGGKPLRSIGLTCATLHLNWKVATCHLRRFAYLEEAGGVAF